jgi:superfamily I DNA/RNA helicase
MMHPGKDYLIILKCIEALPFSVGKKLLTDILRGVSTNASIKKNRLSTNPKFGALAYTESEISDILDWAERKKIIKYAPLQGKRFIKVINLTRKGNDEISNPTLTKEKPAIAVPETIITEQERSLFANFGDFLSPFTDEQKKAIINQSPSILCIAGAGSGKTTVLTKRIEYLTRYAGATPSKILAITFTRKARQEMLKRLHQNHVLGVHVHTFNSFCEQLLRQHASLMYDKPTRVISYSDKIRLVRRALDARKLSPARAVHLYFSPGQRRSKSHERLFSILVNDVFFIIDYYKSQGTTVQDFSIGAADETMAKIMVHICKDVESAKKTRGLRDFMDQLVDGLKLIRMHPHTKPQYEHILIDEYQDVNDLQIEIIDELSAPHTFVVGDPRQAIFGWRGSRLEHMLNRIQTSEVINLTTNYRSLPAIVNFMNKGISEMKLPDLHGAREGDAKLHLIGVGSAQLEFELIIQKIFELRVPREEIFVLARTNRQLNELSTKMRSRNITHVVRSDEVRRPSAVAEGSVTLATIHAIKGLEARVVFVMGCSSNNFPCKASEHPVIELIKLDTYDSEEEERRLFYVAVSRAKDELYLTYSTKRMTSYITREMQDMIKVAPVADAKLLTKLKAWRTQTADILNIAQYMILHDSTLNQVAQTRPTTTEELLKIKGFGLTTIRNYGDAILKIVNK